MVLISGRKLWHALAFVVEHVVSPGLCDTTQASDVDPELGTVFWQANRNNSQTIYGSFWRQLQTMSLYSRLFLLHG